MPPVALIALFTAQTLIASTASATCQSMQCMLPGDLMLSSPLYSTSDPGRLVEQASRSSEIFMNITGSRSKLSDTADEDGYSSRSHAVQFGGMREISTDKFLAYSLAYEEAQQRTNDGLSTINSRLYHAGAALERHWGNWQIQGVVAAGYSRHDAQRHLSPATYSSIGRGRFGSYYGALGTGIAYNIQGSDWYVEPSLSLAAVYQYTPAYRERGLDKQNVHVRRAQDIKTLVTPVIEFGRKIEMDQAVLLYWLSVGANLLPDNSWKTRSHTEGEPSVEITEHATTPAATAAFRMGAVLANHKGWSAHAEYAVQIATNYRDQAGTVRLIVEF